VSSALSLVNRLASHDEQVLVGALAVRAPKTIGVRDLFDLAEALLAPLSIDHGLARLSKDELVQVAAGQPDSDLLAACDALLLGDVDHVFPEVLERAKHWIAATQTDSGVGRTDARTEPGDGPVPATPDDAVVALHEGLVAINLLDDLLAALSLTPARVNSTGTLTKAAAVHLETLMPRSDIDLQSFVAWAVKTPLASVRAGALQVVGDRLAVWAHMTNVERWLMLATTWLERIPFLGRRILRSTSWTEADLMAAAERELIVSHAWIMPTLIEALATARLLGILRGVTVSPAAIAALAQGKRDSDDEDLRVFAEANAPVETETFIVQHDLSIIAPGPLSAQVSAQLRRMSDVESRGMASTFRISAESVSRALASGIDGSELLAFLAKHSVTELPQNLVYLTNDLAAKHGSVRVSRISGRTMVEAATDQLAALLGVDSNVRHLQLTLTSERTFATALEPRSVISVLVEAGYPAIPVDVPSAMEETLEEDLDATLRALVKRLRERDEDIPMDASWLKRQLDLAIRNKQRVTVTVQMPDGERDFELEVTALANGRLRGRDLRGAVERTLPLAFITAVSPAG